VSEPHTTILLILIRLFSMDPVHHRRRRTFQLRHGLLRSGCQEATKPHDFGEHLREEGC
jgi:hypothetical protein